MATFNTELSRDGPGLLLRDIASAKDPQVEAAARVIAAARPDVILLTGIDFDLGLAAIDAFRDRLAATGIFFTYRFALAPNTGVPTAFDLDGDGSLRGAGDAQGFGAFRGQGGMAVLSRLPIDEAAARDFSGLLWRDLPGTLAGDANLPPGALAAQRLSTTGHWDVPVVLEDGRRLHLLAYFATPPVFGAAGNRNALRNRDETAFWSRLLDGDLAEGPPSAPFVLLGDANLDAVDGDGRRDAIAALLSDRRLTDPRPESAGGRAAAGQGGPNADDKGDPAQDTADWPEVSEKTGAPGPGNLRVDYVLPSADLAITAAGVWWPAPGTPEAALAAAASRHRLVWVDIDLP